MLERYSKAGLAALSRASVEPAPIGPETPANTTASFNVRLHPQDAQALDVEPTYMTHVTTGGLIVAFQPVGALEVTHVVRSANPAIDRDANYIRSAVEKPVMASLALIVRNMSSKRAA